MELRNLLKVSFFIFNDDTLNGLKFAQDVEGNWGYIPSGADTVIPFKTDDINYCFIGSIGEYNSSRVTSQSETFNVPISGKGYIIPCMHNNVKSIKEYNNTVYIKSISVSGQGINNFKLEYTKDFNYPGYNSIYSANFIANTDFIITYNYNKDGSQYYIYSNPCFILIK